MQDKSISFEQIKIDMSVSYSQTITDADVNNFAGISGDLNPIHVNDEYASISRYKKRISHGLILGSFFSALFGTKLPGPRCVYVLQTFNFKRPVYLGDTLTETAMITSIDPDKRRVFFDTTCTVKNKIVIDGIAELYVP
jgi:3-hydroxybutyryl-CoA dehydratase